MTAESVPSPRPQRRPPSQGVAGTFVAWAFIAPAFVFYAAFVLVPIGMSVYYSLLKWDGIGKSTFKGLSNYLTVVTDSDLLQVLGNAFQLVAYFTILPVAIGLGVASAIRNHLGGGFGTTARTVLFIPQVIQKLE